MKTPQIQLACLVALAMSSCAAPQAAPTQTVLLTPTNLPPSLTPSPTKTLTPTETVPPPTATATITLTPTPTPQPLLLRRPCGRDYVVRANEAIEIFYGAWGLLGLDLAQQWATALTVELTIDGLPVEGQQQPPVTDLPFNCKPEKADVYWVYYKVVVPELAPGTHNVTVTYHALRALPDGSGVIYGPGQLLMNTFRITSQ
jgi:hypothetical protein